MKDESEEDQRYKAIKALEPEERKLVLMYLEALLSSVSKK